jgi:hypothetical protein
MTSRIGRWCRRLNLQQIIGRRTLSTRDLRLLGCLISSTIAPEAIDLARLAAILRDECGHRVLGPTVGRTRLRDEVVRHLGCSQLEGETLVDTMIGRGFIRSERTPDGQFEWLIEANAWDGSSTEARQQHGAMPHFGASNVG